MASIPPLVNLQAFEAVARRRSFALAATELHLTASAISHQVARLESHLGVRLFERSAHGVRLSAAGEQYLGRVGGALSALGVLTLATAVAAFVTGMCLLVRRSAIAGEKRQLREFCHVVARDQAAIAFDHGDAVR